MSIILNPYISFKDNAREAMEFYRDVFGGTLDVSTFGDFGQTGEGADKVMHSTLDTEHGLKLMASDTPEGMTYEPGSSITISLSGDDDALRDYWAKLSDGGKVTMPLEKQVWGDEFGQCTDRFGIGWLVNISGAQGEQA